MRNWVLSNHAKNTKNYCPKLTSTAFRKSSCLHHFDLLFLESSTWILFLWRAVLKKNWFESTFQLVLNSVTYLQYYLSLWESESPPFSLSRLDEDDELSVFLRESEEQIEGQWEHFIGFTKFAIFCRMPYSVHEPLASENPFPALILIFGFFWRKT